MGISVREWHLSQEVLKSEMKASYNDVTELYKHCEGWLALRW
jgi:hypothetical protein